MVTPGSITFGTPSTFNYPTSSGLQLTEVKPINAPGQFGGMTGVPGKSQSKALVGGSNLFDSGVSLLSTVSSILGAFSNNKAVKTMAGVASSISSSLNGLFSVPKVTGSVGKVTSIAGTSNKIQMPSAVQSVLSGLGITAGSFPTPASFGNTAGPFGPGSTTSTGLGVSAPDLASKAITFASDLAARAMGMVASSALTNNKYQRSYNWEMLLPGIGIIAPEIISKYVQEVQFGEYSIDEVVKLRYGAETRGHAGNFNIPELSIRFLIPVPDIVGTYLSVWKNLIVDNNGFFAPKKNYALTGYLLLLDTTGQQSKSFKLMGMFPTHFPDYRLSYGESAIVTYTAKFNVDRIVAL